MKKNINSLIGSSVSALDGIAGDVTEFFFDDETWFIRYMILKTGNWLSGRKVLISPDALNKSCWETGLFTVNLTKEQIHNSPDIDTDKPVYRQQEIELYAHYDWESYWGSRFYEGGSMGKSNPYPVLDTKISSATDKIEPSSDEDQHLRSATRSTSFHIHSADGEIGRLVDFIMDDQTWQILSLVVETHDLFDGSKVLVDVSHIKLIDWESFKIVLDVTAETVKNGTGFDETTFYNQEKLLSNGLKTTFKT